MATRYAEGKTLGARCSLCDEDASIKFCVDCQQELCPRCSKAHGKIQSTSHHKLIPLEDRYTTGTTEVTGTTPGYTMAHCSKHTSKPLCIICEDCLQALCETCKEREHGNHKVLRTGLDATLLQRISIQKVPELMDCLQQLEKQKDGSPKKLELYKMARDMVITSRDQLWKIIKEDSENLLQEIQNQEKLLSDMSSKIEDVVKGSDQQMSILSSARQMTDPSVLLANIQESQGVIKNAKLLLVQLETDRKSFTIDDILPLRNELQNMEQSLHRFFTMTPVTQGSVSGARTKGDNVSGARAKGDNSSNPGRVYRAGKRDYKSIKRIDSQHLGAFRGESLRISETSEPHSETVVLNTAGGHDIFVCDIVSKGKRHYQCDKRIYKMTTLSRDRHVMIDMDHFDVHLLDRCFRIISTMKRDRSKYTNVGICVKSCDTFILSEIKKYKMTDFIGKRKCNDNTKLSEVVVSSRNTFTQRNLCYLAYRDWNGLLALHSDRQHLTLAITGTLLSTVHLTTGQYTTLDLTTRLGNDMHSIHVDDADKILIGDEDGKVHVASSTRYDGALSQLKVSSKVGGVSIRGDKVVIVAGEYMYIQQ